MAGMGVIACPRHDVGVKAPATWRRSPRSAAPRRVSLAVSAASALIALVHHIRCDGARAASQAQILTLMHNTGFPAPIYLLV